MKSKELFFLELGEEISRKSKLEIDSIESKLSKLIIVFGFSLFFFMFLSATPLVDHIGFKLFFFIEFLFVFLSFHLTLKDKKKYNLMLESIKDKNFSMFQKGYTNFKGIDLYFLNDFLNTPISEKLFWTLKNEGDKEKLYVDRADLTYDYVREIFKY